MHVPHQCFHAARSYALYAERVVCLLVWCRNNPFFCFRSKRNSLSSCFSLHPVRMGLTPGDNNVILCLVNKTVQSTLHMVPTPTSRLVKDGMMYPVVGKYAANCRIHHAILHQPASWCRNHMQCRLHSLIY